MIPGGQVLRTRYYGPPPLMRLALSALLVCLAAAASAQTAHFDDPTDTIQIDGQTVIGTACTYEAVILFPSQGGGGGMVFNEFTDSLEDKQFFFAYAGETAPSTFNAYHFPASSVLSGMTTVTADTWHHIAFVYDGTEERLYVNGTLLASRPISITVGNSSGPGYIGSIQRGALFINSFRGYLDAFRISDVARYAGASFTPPLGDLPSDANTLLLYNFNEPAGSPTIQDEGPSGRTGTLGSGFAAATSPTLGAMPVANEEALENALALTVAPNPARSSARLRYALDFPSHVRLTLHDALGRSVAVLKEGPQPAGEHETTTGLAGLPTGVYLARLETMHGTSVQPLTIVR